MDGCPQKIQVHGHAYLKIWILGCLKIEEYLSHLFCSAINIYKLKLVKKLIVEQNPFECSNKM